LIAFYSREVDKNVIYRRFVTNQAKAKAKYGSLVTGDVYRVAA